MFFQQLVNGLTLGSAYAVIAIGYTLVFGVLNIVNMAHGGIFMIGAYIGLLLVTEAGMNIFPALAGAMIGGAVLGYALELLALRPLRKHKATHLAPLISTIGVSTFLESVALMVWGPQTRSFPSAFGNELMDMGVFKISGIQIISLGTAVVLMVLLTVMLNRTKVGKAIRATSENAETAGLLGINTGRIITLTVMLASALGAAAGVLIGLSFNAIEPTMGTSMGLKGLAVLIMGGLGNVEGAMAGGFILGIAEVFSVAYGTSSYRDAVAFGLIILILFIRPEGLLRKRGREEGRNGRFAEWIFSAGSHFCLHQYYSCHDDLHDALHGHPFFGECRADEFRCVYVRYSDSAVPRTYARRDFPWRCHGGSCGSGYRTADDPSPRVVFGDCYAGIR